MRYQRASVWSGVLSGLVLTLSLLGSAATAAPSSMATPMPGGGVITYHLPEGHVYRLRAQEGAQPEDVSLALNALAPGSEDDWLSISPDGAWLLLSTDRFDPQCAGWPCLALIQADLSAGEVVRAGDEMIHPSGFGAVASGGALIVYPDGGGPHDLDLWAISLAGDTWSRPVLLTGDSPFAWNAQPAIVADGGRLLFDCGDQPYAGMGTAICEVRADGADFRVVWTPDEIPLGEPAGTALHHADYASDGSLVWEADWGGERVWRLSPDGSGPVLVAGQLGNDNSPCVLPDGRIVSLWLQRPGNSQGHHEIKVMAADGNRYFMALAGIDVEDSGLGCGADTLP
ncbi:MAG TPA: hypothetical protein VMT24_14240 [Aggregatilineaceae bacterium]|nr:hypothetical protein [Aggregatilineaceae bacterium]